MKIQNSNDKIQINRKKFKSKIIIFLICHLMIYLSFDIRHLSFADTKYLTKGEAAAMISETNFIKQKIGELLSWAVGYDISKINRVKLVPTINYIKAVPKAVPPDGRTVIEVYASVSDPAGLRNIAGVRADLSNIGKLPNTMLVDNGLWGDKSSQDGVYTLQTSVSMQASEGPKEISVAAINKNGWLAYTRTALVIEKNPLILWVKAQPDAIRADGKSILTLSAKIENPGRIEDARVSADLYLIGGERDALFSRVKDVFILQTTISSQAQSGSLTIPIKATNYSGGKTTGEIEIKVVK